MSSNLIRKSPNEIHRENLERLHNERISRLKDLRLHQQKWQAERRLKYNEITKNGWNKLLQNLLQDWLRTKMDECDQLLNLKEVILAEIGAAHQSAADKTRQENDNLDAIIKEMVDCQKKAQDRGKKAGKMLREEQRVRLEPTWIKRALMDNVKQVEAMRSRLAVRKQRLHSALSEVTESGPCPTLKVANIPKRNYHDTHYHAEYLKPKLTSAVQPSLMSNVSNDAQNEERRRIDNEKLQRLKKQQDANLAAKRYNKAMQTVLMEKKENQIMKELKNLDKADRIRKQAFSTNNNADSGSSKLTNLFAKQLHLKDSVVTSSESSFDVINDG